MQILATYPIQSGIMEKTIADAKNAGTLFMCLVGTNEGSKHDGITG